MTPESRKTPFSQERQASSDGAANGSGFGSGGTGTSLPLTARSVKLRTRSLSIVVILSSGSMVPRPNCQDLQPVRLSVPLIGLRQAQATAWLLKIQPAG